MPRRPGPRRVTPPGSTWVVHLGPYEGIRVGDPDLPRGRYSFESRHSPQEFVRDRTALLGAAKGQDGFGLVKPWGQGRSPGRNGVAEGVPGNRSVDFVVLVDDPVAISDRI